MGSVVIRALPRTVEYTTGQVLNVWITVWREILAEKLIWQIDGCVREPQF